MKKAFDQTVRDLKREVNKKVLKVPNIEQKILDATSNEPWGPHGSLLADIAQATRNYHEYQMIMNVIWKRINDTGKNWRHVYKALTVLEYLVAHGSERVIDEIKEHAYQISALSDFQYIDSSGRDQGNNVRRKSQSLVALVNDKERIQEVRQKAAANRDKYRSTFSTRPGSYPSLGGFGDRYDDDRYSSREEDRYGNGRERDWGYRDDDRSSKGGDSYGRDGDRYGRYSDERFGKDGYRDDDYRGRGNDDYHYGSRARSLSRDRSYDDDDRSTRSGGRAADDLPRDERQLDRKLSEQNISAPPSYEEATRDAQGRVQEERNEGEFTAAAASKARLPSAPSPSENTNQGPSPFVPAESSPKGTHQDSDHVPAGASAVTNNNNNNGFDEFDPRGSIPAAPPAASLEMDFFGSVTDSVYSLALVPISMNNTGSEADIAENSGFVRSSSGGFSQPDGNPFGDPPFKAAQENIPNQQQSFVPTASFNASISTGGAETLPPATSMIHTASTFDFDGSFGGVSFTPASDGGQSSYASPVILTSEAPVTQPSNHVSGMFGPQTVSTAFVPPQETQPVGPTHSQGNLFPQSGPTASFASQAPQFSAQAPQFSAQAHPVAQVNMQLNLLSKPSAQASTTMEMTAPASTFTHVKSTSKEKFEAKSTVWAETLNRGLVNLNISGPKINPHADIGVDFDSINRKDRMKEEKKAPALISTTTMGKAMGSGSGMGRAGASAFTAPSNPMMGSGMAMGMGMGMPGSGGMRMGTMGGGMGMGMGTTGYGGNMGRPMGVGVNMGTNLGMPAQRPIGGPPGGSGMSGYGYNPMMGGNYGSQQQYGGGYR